MVRGSKTRADIRFSGNIAIIDIVGDLTPDAREAVENARQQVHDSGRTRVVVVFDRDAYINSGGIAIVINLAIAGTKAGQKIRIVQPSIHFMKIFTIVGLRQYVEIFSDEEEALAGFDS